MLRKMTLREHLRASTAQAHESIEANPMLARLLAQDLSEAEYRRILERYFGFFQPLEKDLSNLAEFVNRVPAFAARMRSERLRLDLQTLGLEISEIESLPRCEALPPHTKLAEFVGVLYVLEGSNLGGKLIAKHLRALPFTRPACLNFFESPDVSENWKSFLTFLNDVDSGNPSFHRDAAQAAQETFRSLDRWMAR